MEKIIFNLTDAEIDAIIFEAFDKDVYWIQKKDRKRPNELKGTVVVLKFRDEKTKGKVEIQYMDDKIVVEGIEDRTIIRKLYHAYHKMVNSKIPEYKQQYEESEELISSYIEQHAQEVKTFFFDFLYEEAGFMSTNAVKSKIETFRLAGKTPTEARIGNHVTFVKLKPNEFNTQEREIEVGGVYYADLNPVAGEEYGGFRPVVIIGHTNDKTNYVCLPLSSKDSQGESVGTFDGKDSYAVTNRPRIISPERLYRHLGKLDNDKYKTVVKLMKGSLELFDSLSSEEKTEEKPKAAATQVIPKVAPKVVNNINYKSFQNQPQDALHIEMIEKELVYPTEEEIMEIITRRVDHLKVTKKWNFIYEGKSKKLAYDYEVECRVVKISLNTNHQDYSKQIYPCTFKVKLSDFSVKLECPVYESGEVKDSWCTTEFQKLMMKKNDKYHLYMLYKRAATFHAGYVRKSQNMDEEEKKKLLNENVGILKGILDMLGIVYKGDLESLILSGEKALDFSLCSRESEDEDASENE